MGLMQFLGQATPGGNPYGWNNQLYNPIDAKGAYTQAIWITIGILVLLTIVIFIWGHAGFPLPTYLKWLKKTPKDETDDQAFERMCVQKMVGRREREILKSMLYKVDPKLARDIFTDPNAFAKLQLVATGRDLNTLKDIRLKFFGTRE